MTYELLGRYKEAIADCNAALKIFTDEDRNEAIMLYTVRGRSYAVTLEFGLALLDFNKLIRLKPDDAQGYFYRGVIYANLEVLDKAIADFRKGLELKPGDANITDSLLQAENELKAKEMQERLKKKAKPARPNAEGGQAGEVPRGDIGGTRGARARKYEDELNQLKGEIKTIKELLIEIVRPKPEYSIPRPTQPEIGIFRIPVRQSIIMPVTERPQIKRPDNQ